MITKYIEFSPNKTCLKEIDSDWNQEGITYFKILLKTFDKVMLSNKQETDLKTTLH